MSTHTVAKTHRVAEIFGPTIQGEGAMIGAPCIFIRFGGCDFRCAPCDSPHAVLPDFVSKLPSMNDFEISHKVAQLAGDAGIGFWVVYSGGNPGLRDLSILTRLLRNRMKFRVQCETQGSTYRQWYNELDHLCISPKGPGMRGIPSATFKETDLDVLANVLNKVLFEDEVAGIERDPIDWMSLKVVCFSDADIEYAKVVQERFPGIPLYLSVGNEDMSLPTVAHPNPVMKVPDKGHTQAVVLQKLTWLMERVASDSDLANARVTPQLHVLAWGNERGR